MDNILTLLYYGFTTLFAYFVVAPFVLNAFSLFGVQKRFAQTMVEEKVIKQSDVTRIHQRKARASVLVSGVLVALLVYLSLQILPWGILCGAVPLALGFFKFRAILQFNSLTVKKFRSTYEQVMDTKRYNRYVEKHF